MHIEDFRENEIDRNLRRKDLLHLINQFGEAKIRPCLGCEEPCTCSRRSITCGCDCFPECPLAKYFLSPDPVLHPIESQILPLVYALAALRVVQPCYSCEGHLDWSGCLEKIPEVWFYAASVVYPGLIAQYLAELKVRGTINYRWIVSLCPFKIKNEKTVYSIHAEPGDFSKTQLHLLQLDSRAIADGLLRRLRQLALEHLKTIQHH